MYQHPAMLEAVARQQINDRVTAAQQTRRARQARGGRLSRQARRPQLGRRTGPGTNPAGHVGHATTVTG